MKKFNLCVLLCLLTLCIHGCSSVRSSFMSGVEIKSEEMETDQSFGLTYAQFKGTRKETMTFDSATYIRIQASIKEGSIRFIVKNSEDDIIFDGDEQATGFDLPAKGKYTFEIQSDSKDGQYIFSWE